MVFPKEEDGNGEDGECLFEKQRRKYILTSSLDFNPWYGCSLIRCHCRRRRRRCWFSADFRLLGVVQEKLGAQTGCVVVASRDFALFLGSTKRQQQSPPRWRKIRLPLPTCCSFVHSFFLSLARSLVGSNSHSNSRQRESWRDSQSTPLIEFCNFFIQLSFVETWTEKKKQVTFSGLESFVSEAEIQCLRLKLVVWKENCLPSGRNERMNERTNKQTNGEIYMRISTKQTTK